MVRGDAKLGNAGKPRMEKLYDLVIKNARVVRPNKASVDCLDIAVKDGKVARLAPDIQGEQAKQVFDAKNLLAFPGCVDAHMHIGIYAPLAEDAVSESKAAAMGGVTSSPKSSSNPMDDSGSITAITLRPSRPDTSMKWNISPSTTASLHSRYSC